MLAGLAGCVAAPPGGPAGPVVLRPAGPTAKVAVLLPLTGPNAVLGNELLQAVQLALGVDGPQLDVRDTASTPTGATAAAQAAVANGDGMILGPLTAPETAAAAAVATTVPILAFTSDRQQGRPGVWALGITPQQQVARLVRALSSVGKTRVAAVLPDNVFGSALADGLTRAAGSAGDPLPLIKRYGNGSPLQLDAALRDVADYAHRRGVIDAQVRAARDSTDPAMQAQADSLAQQTPGPAPFDALLLAESSGPLLASAVTALPKYDIAAPEVQVMGPTTWSHDAGRLSGLEGAWFAAPDPAARTAFVQAYSQKYGKPPSGFADIAFDAASIARVAVGRPGVLTQIGGFPGVDGPIGLRPDGSVLRGLAVFTVEPGGSRIVDPVPAAFGPGS